MIDIMTSEMIAPCGVNCSVCYARLRTKNRCAGCLPEGPKLGHCSKCSIKFCAEHEKAQFTRCLECARFPCARLRRLHQHYIKKYGVDLQANLRRIHDAGLDVFLAEETARWTCPSCGAVLCMHQDQCGSCGRDRR